MLLSLIVPVYNVSKYLPSTLKSIKNQSLQDMEVLCIDDCSTDNSWDLLLEAAQLDSRIRLLRQEKNMGVGLARKRAVSESKGKYIMFLDGDDALEDDACQKLVTLMEQKPVDILHFATTIKSEDNISNEEEQNFYNFSKPYQKFLHREDLYNACFYEHLFGFTLWNKIYQGNIVRKAFECFPDVRMDIAEDLLTFFMITCFASTYDFCNESFYIYNFGGGITGGKIITLKQMHQYAQQGDTLKFLDVFLDDFGWQDKCRDARNWVAENFADAAIYNWLVKIGSSQAAKAFDIIVPHFNSEDLLRSCAKGMREWGVEPRKLAERLHGSNIFLPQKREVRTIATYYFRAYNGGVERVMTKLSEIWSDMGYRVLLITDEAENEHDYSYPESVTRISLDQMEAASSDAMARRLLNIYKIMRDYEVDLFVYHAWCSPTLVGDTLAVKMAGTSMIVHTHNLFSQGYRAREIQYPIQTALLGLYYELVDGIIALSDVDAAWWRLWHPCVFHSINPVTWKYEEVLPSEPQNHNILWIARISQEKRPMLALQIMKLVLLRVPDAVLHVVGNATDISYYHQFLAEIEQLELTGSVVLHGFQTNVRKYYEMCRLYLSTSEYEGQPLTMVESKIMARPCVTFNLENLDMVREGQGMLVVPQGDIYASAEAIVSILLDPSLWQKLSREAHESARSICEYDQYAAWSKIINKISIGANPPNRSSANTAVRMQTQDLLTCFDLLGHEIKYYREAFEWNLKQANYFKHELDYYVDHSRVLERQLNKYTAFGGVFRLGFRKLRSFINSIRIRGFTETWKAIRDKLCK